MAVHTQRFGTTSSRVAATTAMVAMATTAQFTISSALKRSARTSDGGGRNASSATVMTVTITVSA